MKRISNIIFVILFAVMLLVPLFMTNMEEGAVSSVDGRTLVTKPSISEYGYNTKMETWLRDRLGLRDHFSTAFSTANDKLFDELIDPSYQYGKDGYTFFRIHNNIQYNSFHELFAEFVYSMQKYCESRGSKFYYVFNPERESVCREHLPEGVNYNDEWVDSMLAALDEKGVNYVDLRSPLANADKEEKVFDKINESGRWNEHGAFIGMRELTKRMRRDIPELKVLEEEEYKTATVPVSKKYTANKIFNEEVPTYSLKAETEDISGNLKSEMKINPNSPYFQLVRNDSPDAESIERLLLFEDDLYAQFAFARAKDTLAVSCLNNTVAFDYYYNIFKPDVVVFECMEAVTGEAFFDQAEIEAADWNPAILENFPENSFPERRDSLLRDITDFETEAAAILMPGEEIDRVIISDALSEARYAWLITNDMAIDLNRNEQGAFIASIRHGELKEGSDVALCIQTENGEKKKTYITVTNSLQNIAKMSKTATKHTSIDMNSNRAEMISAIADNMFSYTSIHMYSPDNTEYYGEMGIAFAAGTVDGAYCHNLPTGDYRLLLLAGGNLTAEWASYTVHLEEGKTYWFSYTVDELSAKRVKLKSFSFLDVV